MKLLWLWGSIVLLFIIAISVQADVVLKKKMSFEGMMGMGSNETTETEYVQADRSCSEKVNKVSGGMMGKSGKERQDVLITRIDKGIMWNLDVKKKTYTEMSLTSIKDMMNQAKDDTAPGKNDESAQSDYEWTSEVKQLDEVREVNGFKCKGLVGTALGVNKKDPNDKIRMTSEFWVAVQAPEMKELEEYYKAYAKLLGVDPYQSQLAMDQMTQKYSSQFGGLFTDKLSNLGGYPIKVSMKMEKSGGLGSQGKSEDDEKAAEMMSKLGNLMGGKKKMEKSADGMTTVFSMITEVTSIESKPVEAGKFEVPPDFKKK